MNRLLVAVAALILPFTAVGEADYDLDIFELHHRPAEELLPALQPLLAEGAVISHETRWLLVRSTPENLREVSEALRVLDRPLQQLEVTVLHGSGPKQTEAIKVRRTDPAPATETQRVQVLEGRWCQIALGLLHPFAEQQVHSASGTISQQVKYGAVETAMEARVRLVGETVYLDIRPARAELDKSDGGRVAYESLTTTVAGGLGEWLELGATLPGEEGRNANIRRTHSEPQMRTLARVELVPLSTGDD